jgi:hypothetical protein
MLVFDQETETDVPPYQSYGTGSLRYDRCLFCVVLVRLGSLEVSTRSWTIDYTVDYNSKNCTCTYEAKQS